MMLCALACVIPVSGLATGHVLDKTRPTINTTKWVSVALPFRPVEITAVKDAMWVCGTNEMIAVSTDGGVNWRMQHEKKDSEILTNIAFVNTMIGHASGTNGLLLSTNDGGQTWSSLQTAGTIRQFSFADLTNGIADVDGVLKLTSDGGRQWRDIGVMKTDEQLRKFTEVMSLAALSPTHMAAAIRQPEVQDRFISTVDGGKTWTSTFLPNTIATSLFVHDGEYWAFGIEYLGREHNPGGGYSVPVALHSKDAQTWQHGVRATWEFSGCTAQGCILPYGVIEVLYGATETTWSLPQNLPTTRNWAMSGNRICVVDRELRCGSALASDTPQPAPENASSEMFRVAQNEPLLADCLDCSLPMIHFDAAAVRGQAMAKVTVLFSVNRDGTVGSIEIKGAPSQPIAEDIRKSVASWLIAPAHHGDESISQKRTLELRVFCNAGFPGHPETAMCMAQPSSGPAQLGVSVITSETR
jgi:Photosynthesis system II assembly factor YCF48